MLTSVALTSPDLKGGVERGGDKASPFPLPHICEETRRRRRLSVVCVTRAGPRPGHGCCHHPQEVSWDCVLEQKGLYTSVRLTCHQKQDSPLKHF